MNLVIRLLLFTCLLGECYIGSIQAQQSILPSPKRQDSWESQMINILIQVDPKFWKTTWYLILALCALFSICLWTVMSLNRQCRLRKELARKVLEAASLHDIDTVKSQYFANVTHDFRTPLTIILNAHEQLAKTTLTELQQQQTDIIQRHAHQLLRLITEALDITRLDAGKLESSTQLGDPVAFIREVVAQFGGLARQSKIDLTFNSDEQMVTSASGQSGDILYSFDGDKWEKITYNLLANALKFTPAGGSVCVTGFISRTDRFTIRVADTGIGIPKDQLARIFERFYQVDEGSTRAYSGTGIGLALVRELTDWLGGSVAVESEVGGGSVLTIELPLIPQSTIEPWPSKPALPQRHPIMKMPIRSIAVSPSSIQRNFSVDKPLVLVVEDNKDLRTQLIDFLSVQYWLLSAPNGCQGLEQALAEVPDLIVSDVMMPEMDGYELVERLKSNERTSHIPVILLTARSSPESRLKGLQAGADDYLGKPFSLIELELRINNGLRTRQNLQKQFMAQPVLTVSAPTPESDREARFLSRVHQAILDNIELETLDVEWLASQAGMSRTQLHRKLTALTNLSPNRFIHRVRLERAAELLKEGELNVAQVAYKVGYNSQSYFAKVFQDYFGYSPAKFKGTI
ncbi:His Kinase A (phospho-acceptor) domain-containing protein [Spirosoma fluviale]|uniref:histidine kinase n=2 Tax=Spirosoma fluviale TaxID=1597977 RepID=A0A286GQJ0_9BACT|nr:His Kinase A (phospho-acceptor) domain-containing protein [Spirosoma fluviale]